MKIVIFDPQLSYARGLRYYLQQAGHRVTLVQDIASLTELLREETPDLLIAERNLVEIAGSNLEGIGDKLPFVLPIKNLPPVPPEEDTPPEGPTKVYNNAHRQQVEEILGQLPRLRRGNITRIRVGGLSLDFGRKHASFYGRPLRLTPLQFKLLGALGLNAKRVVSYAELLEQVWGFEGNDQEARELLKVHVNRIRQKMKAACPQARPHIHAVRGFGYMLAGPARKPPEPSPE